MSNQALVVLQPLPDEFALGHVGRMHRVNAARGPLFSFVQDVLSQHAAHPSQGAPAAHQLAYLCGMGEMEYVQNHTLLPLAAFSKSTRSHRAPWTPRLVGGYAWGNRSYRAKWCSVCIAQDVSRVGFSYWRRTHQVKGILLCHEHAEPLHGFDDRNPFIKFPEEAIAMAHPVAQHVQRGETAVRRYEQIASRLLNEPSESEIDDVLMLVNSTHNFGRCKFDAKTRSFRMPNDCIEESFSSDWRVDITAPFSLRAGSDLVARGEVGLIAALAIWPSSIKLLAYSGEPHRPIRFKPAGASASSPSPIPVGLRHHRLAAG